MIFHYAGKYSGDESQLPTREHHPDAVPFKEPENMQKLSMIANSGCMVLILLLAVPFVLLGMDHFVDNAPWLMLGCIGSMLVVLPHELLHAVCFRKDVYMYNNLSQGLMFVIGTEDMSRGRFVFMSLLPNIVFGLIPYVVFLFFPHLTGLGAFGLICLGMGFGDYINVYNALTQVPRSAKVYMSGMHSYWYL